MILQCIINKKFFNILIFNNFYLEKFVHIYKSSQCKVAKKNIKFSCRGVNYLENTNKLIIKDLKIYAYHGDLSEEKTLGQFFLLDFVFSLRDFTYLDGEEIENTVDYVKIIKHVKKKFTERNFDLIESAASYLCDSVLENFPKIFKVELTLKKTSPPIDAIFNYVAVEIVRERK